MRPAAAWGLALVLVASALTAGGVWHYQTDHRNSATGAVVEAEAPGAAGAAAAASPPLEDGFGGFSATEVDAIAWARTDLFAVLGELESNEEDLLRQLIVEAAVEDGLDDAGPTFEPAGTLRRGTLQ